MTQAGNLPGRVVFALTLAAASVSLLGCDMDMGGVRAAKASRDRDWNEPCHDKSSLLATTINSPDVFECPNKLHRMRVTVATKATNEEAAALVFCECVHAEAKP